MQTRDTIRNGPATIKAVTKAADILMCFTPQQPELSLGEISEQVRQGKTTVRRLLFTLARSGFITQNPVTRRYGLGLAIWSLASSYPWHLQVSSNALPWMRKLRDLTGETVSLHLVIKDQCISVEKVESLHEMRTTSQIGKALPWGVGATTKVILAHMLGEDQDWTRLEYLKGSSTSGHSPRFEKLALELKDVLVKGFVMSVDEAVQGASAVAAPLIGPDGKVLAAITISGPSSRFKRPQMIACVPQLKEYAEKLGRQLWGVGKRCDAPGQDREEVERAS